MKHFCIILFASCAWAQVQTPLTIHQSAGTARGEIRFQERRTNGQDYVGFVAPQSVPTSVTWTLPGADGAAGSCWSTDGAATLSFLVECWAGTRTTSDSGFHESINIVSSYAGVGAAPTITWKSNTDSGPGTPIADLHAYTTSNAAGGENSWLKMRIISAGTRTELLRLNGDTKFVQMPEGQLIVGDGYEPNTRVFFNDYDQPALGKVFVVDAQTAVPTADTGSGKFQMRRMSGSGTIAGGDRTDVRALEAHTTCEFGTGYCWGMELRIGSAISPVSQTIQNVGIVIESKSADWIASPNCNGSGTVGCVNNMGVVVLGVDGWEWPYAYIDTAANVDWFVDQSGRTNTRGVRFIDLSGNSGYSIYWEAEAVATVIDSYWILKDNGGTAIIKIDREISNTAVNAAYVTPDWMPATNLGASLGSSSLYWLNLYALNITSGTILPTTTGTYSIGATGNRFVRAFFTGGISSAGPSYWESGSEIIMRSGSTMTLEFGTPGAGKVLTSDASGVATWQAAAGASAPLSLVADVATISTTGAHLMITGSTDTAEKVVLGYNTTGNHGYLQTIASGPTYTPLAVQPLGGTMVVGNDLDYESTGAAVHINKTLALLAISGYDALAPNMQFRSARGSAGSPTATQSGDRIGQFAFFGYGSSTRGNPSASIAAFAEATFTDTSKPAYIAFATAATSESNRTERWRISGAGHILAGADNTYDIGASGATRPRNVYVAGTTDIAGNLSAAVINATGSPAYRVGGTTVIDASRNATFQGLTVLTYVSSSLIPSLSATYELGSASLLWNNIHAETMTVYTTLQPDASASANLGGSTKRWTKTWTADLDVTGTITPPSGTAFSGTKTVRDAAGTGTCTLTFSSGIMTGGTC